MAVIETQAIPVREMSQAGQVRRAAAVLAESIGFDSEETGRVGLVATEAATNLVKHAQGGEIVLSTVREPEMRAVEIVALDRGPGIRDLDRALRDGFSTREGSIGGGLGAIRRIATCFDLYSGETGTILFARVGAEPRGDASAIEVGAVQVPCPGEELSGDAWAVAHRPDRTLVLVVDGLGHGADAHAASSLAARLFLEHTDEGPVSILERIHEGLRATRGAAGAVLELDLQERVGRFVGIGNISASVHAPGEQRSMVSHHGVLGHSVRKVHEFVYPWPRRALVLLHTDGIATHWDLARYPGLQHRHPAVIAGALYRDFGRGRDDATAVALREAA
ncbi:MAG TPA: ATP-binding protein [Candidatus Binatia bacterium]|nr:ATP-binding protein [Candidatus Binatia bacterium]